MNGFANVSRLASHLDRQTDFADEITGMRSYDAAADQAMRRLIEQELGEAFVATVGDRAP